MKHPVSGDRIANVVFVVCCLVLVGVAASRYWAPPGRQARAREDFLKPGSPDPFGVAVSSDHRPLACIFISSTCPVCGDSLPFYKRLAERVAATGGRAALVFVATEPSDTVSAYLRTGGIGDAVVASVARPSGIPGSPSIVLLNRFRRVERSWAGRLSRRQESEIETLISRE